MAASRIAMLRYLAIDRQLQRNKQGVAWETLADACFTALQEAGYDPAAPPSRRTIMADIKVMREGSLGYSAPIEYRKGMGYRYADPRFTTTSSPVLLEDVKMLRQVAGWLRQLTNDQLPGNLDGLITRIEDSLRTHEKKEAPFVLFEAAPNPSGQQWLRPLYDAILSRQAIAVSYHPFVDPVIDGTVSPYLLREYNNRWFLLAFHHDLKKVLTMALDRITAISPLQLTNFYIDPAFSPTFWFRDIIGVSKPFNQAPVEVSFLATPLRAQYLRTKPIHHSQREGQASTNMVAFTIFVIPNYELEMQLLSFGEDIEVLAPVALRARLRERLVLAMERYR